MGTTMATLVGSSKANENLLAAAGLSGATMALFLKGSPAWMCSMAIPPRYWSSSCASTSVLATVLDMVWESLASIPEAMVV